MSVQVIVIVILIIVILFRNKMPMLIFITELSVLDVL